MSVLPEVELIEQSTNDQLEDGEIEDDGEEEPASGPANSLIQVIDGEENIDTVIKEAYRDLPKLSAKVVTTVAKPSETVDDLEAQRKGLLEALKRKKDYSPPKRRDSPNARYVSKTRYTSKESTRRSRAGTGTANCQINGSSRKSPTSGSKTSQKPASSRHESHSGRSSRARERNVMEPRRDMENKAFGGNFVLSPPPPPPNLPLSSPDQIPIPQSFPQQGVNKVTKQPLLPTPLRNINFPNTYASGINPIPPPPPRSTPFFPPYQTPYSPPAYNSQSLSMQSTSQYSPQAYFNQMPNYSAPGLRQPPLLQEAAHLNWSIEVDNFLQTNTKNHLDNYEEVGMDLASPASTTLVEEEAVVESVQNDEDELETLRRNLLEQQEKSKKAQRQVVLSRDCSPNTQKDLPKKATVHPVNALQLEEIKTELEGVCQSIDDSGKRIEEHSHRYKNLKKELENTLNAIKSEKEKLEEHFKRQLELVAKREWMELQMEKNENWLEQSQREEKFYKDVDNELTAVKSLLYRSKHLEEKIKNKARNSAFRVTDHQPSPPLVEESRNEPEDKRSEKSSPKAEPRTTRKRSNSDQRVRSTIKLRKSEPRDVSEPMVITISSSKDPSLEENQVASEAPTSNHSPEPLVAKVKAATRKIRQQSPQRSFPNKKLYLLALANAYAPPNGRTDPRFVRIADKCSAEEMPNSPTKYGVGRGLIVNRSPYRSFVGPLHGKILVKPSTNKQYSYSQTQHQEVMYVEEVAYVADDIQTLNNMEGMVDEGHSVEQESRVSDVSDQEGEQLDETLLRQKLLARINAEKANCEAISRPSTSKNNAFDDSYGEWEPASPTYHTNEQSTDAELHEDVLISVGGETHVKNDKVERNLEALDKNAISQLQETKNQVDHLAYNPVSPNYVPGIDSNDHQAQNMDYQQDRSKVFDKVDSTYDPISMVYDAKTATSVSCVLDGDAHQIFETLNGSTSASQNATSVNDAEQKEQPRDIDVYTPEAPPYEPISPNYEPERTLADRKKSLLKQTSIPNSEELKEPTASTTVSATPFDTSLPLCSNELIYAICLDSNCQMQHMGNKWNASTSTTPMEKPKSPKKKAKVGALKIYEGEEAEIADYIRQLYAELPRHYLPRKIESAITQLVQKWEDYKGKGKNNSLESFKKIIQKLIARGATRAENDGTSTGQALKTVVLNQDLNMVPEYQSRISF